MKSVLLLFMPIFCFTCCKQSSYTDYALIWSANIKSKILEDANLPVDSISIDTSNKYAKEITLYSHRIRTKVWYTWKSNGDTLACDLYSKSQNFKIVRELCPGIERNFEAISFRGRQFGSIEFRFCNGKLKEQGFRFDDGGVGVVKEWDEQGTLIKETDLGNIEKLQGLRSIYYDR